MSVRKEFDRKVQRAKRLHWYRFQPDLMQECNDNSTEVWRTIGKVGIGQTRKRHIPMEVILRDGTVSRDPVSVLDKWKHDFSSLLNCQHGVVGWCEGVVYLTSPGRPTDIGLQLGKACYPCSR